MESKAKLLGHPLHTTLIVIPMGLLVTAVIFDVIYLITGNATFTEVAFYMIGAEIIGALVAAIFGAIDWLAIPVGTRAKTIANLHGGGNLVVTGLFIASFVLRLDTPRNPGMLAYLLTFVGVSLALVTGWLGGELVNRLRVGVDDDAHLNAPSSLSGRPASEQAQGYGSGL